MAIDNVRKKFTEIYDLIFTTYHEAGHAIMGLSHFMKVDSVYVFENRKNKRIEGICDLESVKEPGEIVDPDLINYILISDICAMYAGLITEKCLFKTLSGSDKFPLFLKNGSSDDTLFAAKVMKQYNLAAPGQKRYNFKKKLIKQTLSELENNWESISLVAHTLHKKKKLNYEELKFVLTKKSKNKEYWKRQFKIIDFIFEQRDNLGENEIKTMLSI